MVKNEELTKKFYPFWDKFNAGCYGEGEGYLIETLQTMFKTFEVNEHGNINYNYEKIEEALGKHLGWAMIVLIDHAGFIEWGTSIRFGWIPTEAHPFIEMVLNNSVDALYDVATIELDDMIRLNLV